MSIYNHKRKIKVLILSLITCITVAIGSFTCVQQVEAATALQTFNYTGGVQTFTAPYSGTYQLEVWGAQGGNSTTGVSGGKGGYSKGNISLTQGQTLYVYVGGQPTGVTGGYNGGGTGAAYTAGGGGATHIATTSGLLSSLTSNTSFVKIVAGGGGGGGKENSAYIGGAGGGTTGGNGLGISNTTATGGSQTAGGVCHSSSDSVVTGSFGLGGSYKFKGSYAHMYEGAAGGGGGWYGGAAGTYNYTDDGEGGVEKQYNGGGGGGSGYIGGVTSGSMQSGIWSGNGKAVISIVSYDDITAPTISSVSYSTAWTNTSITATVTATDNVSATANLKYAMSTSSSLTASSVTGTSKSFTITANGTYYFYVKDECDNVAKKTVTVSNIDKTGPTITVNSIPTAMTNQNITVTYSASDSASGVAAYAVSTSSSLTASSITGTATSYAVSTNGTYYVYAKDNAGNVSKKSFTVSCIDKTAPTITIDEIPSDWTAGNVTVTYSATDSGSGVVAYAVSSDDSLTADKVTGTATSYTVSTNGTYYVYAKDAVGNISKKSFKVSTIDKAAPIITIDEIPSDWTTGNVTITYSATDSESGVVAYAVSSDDSLTADKVTGTATSYTVTQNGTYYVYAKDAVGNMDKKSFVISTIDREAPELDLSYYKGIEVIESSWNEDGTNTKAKLKVIATDDVSPSIYYRFVRSKTGYDTGYVTTDTFDFTFNTSETLTLYVKDIVGNEITETIPINIAYCSINCSDNEVIEEEEYSFNYQVRNAYDWELQYQPQNGNATPLENAWVKATENIKFTSSNEGTSAPYNFRNDIFFNCPIGQENAWYRILIHNKKESEEGFDFEKGTRQAYFELKVEELAFSKITATYAPVSDGTPLEAGTKISIGDLSVMAEYNSNKKNPVNLTEHAVYKEDVYFVLNAGTTEEALVEEITPKTVKSNDVYTVRFVHDDRPADATISFDVVDTTSPEFYRMNGEPVVIDGIVFSEEPKPIDLSFSVYARDNSDGEIYYRVGLADESDYTTFDTINEIKYTITGDSLVRIWIMDESGNMNHKDIFIKTQDIEAPTIDNVIISPDLSVKAPEYTFIVEASDDNDVAFLEYKFVLNGQIMQDYSSEKQFTYTAPGIVQIYVKDKAGHITVSEEFTISNIDNGKPVIEDVVLRVVDGTVVAKVIASDDNTPSTQLIYSMSSYGGSYRHKENIFYLSQSGTYKFTVTDEAGNSSSKDVIVNINALLLTQDAQNIIVDVLLEPLGNVYTYDGINYTNGKIKVIPVLSADVDLGKALYSYRVAINTQEQWSQTPFCEVESNGEYVVSVRDVGAEDTVTGQIVYKANVNVQTIDTEAPTISLVQSGSAVKVYVKDNLAGVDSLIVTKITQEGYATTEEYSVNSHTSEMIKTITTDTTSGYECYAIDNVGNKSETYVLKEKTEMALKAKQHVWVAFVDYDNTLVSLQKIQYGSSAVAPEAPTRKGYTFSGWSNNYTKVTNDITYVYAQYTKSHTPIGYTKPVLPEENEDDFPYSNPTSGYSQLRSDVTLQEFDAPSDDIFILKRKTVDIDDAQSSDSWFDKLMLSSETLIAVLITMGLLLLILLFIYKRRKDEEDGAQYK